jgi:hypothetical protein
MSPDGRLTDGDRAWLQGNFDRIHDRINKSDSAIHHAREKITEDIAAHEKRHHDPVKTWGIVGAIATALLAIWEGVKFLVKKG